ncbi:early nodulin-75-like [Vanessa atalanta]|uniref:early nodulin-75-like n=1 Tax=Vanessa atalanta TaxID=42275 RepID=UPI001FCD17DD|nr:early nodulin-75-like [Vanessa atalanta]
MINHILRTRNKRDTRNRNFNYGSFYDEYPRYEGLENKRPWHFYRTPPHERPNYYEATHTNREIEPHATPLRKQPYERRSYDDSVSHHIETRSSQLDSTWRDRQARPWPPRQGGPPYHEPPPPNRESFWQDVPPPPPFERPFPHIDPPPYEPPPHRNPPPHPPPQGPPQDRRSPLSEREFQPEVPPPIWETPNNWKPPPRDRNVSSYRDSNSEINSNEKQENTTSSDINSSNAMDKISNNQDMAFEKNYQYSKQSTRSYLNLFQVQPVTPEE